MTTVFRTTVGHRPRRGFKGVIDAIHSWIFRLDPILVPTRVEISAEVGAFDISHIKITMHEMEHDQ